MKHRLRCTSMALAITSALSAGPGLLAPAHAINLAPNGKGEVLIFPYYTVRNGFDTLVSVTNTSDRTVLAAMRLREAKNGRQVSEFYLALSPHDVWTGAVTLDGSDGAVVRTYDPTCSPLVFNAGPNGSKQFPVSSGLYDGTDTLPYDTGGRERSRVQEGYIEVIEMGISTVPEPSIPSTGSSIETASQHVNGTPRDCAAVQAAFENLDNFQSGSGPALATSVFSTFEAPKNVLFGSSTVINVGSGHAYDATPTTIQNFRSGTPIIYSVIWNLPTLAHGDTGMTAVQFTGDGNVATTPNIASSVDAVSIVLMADALSNEYAIGSTATSGAGTEWVVTFPTKHFYTDPGEISVATPPFSQSFDGGSCDKLLVTMADREEAVGTYPPALDFSGSPGSIKTTCSSANVVSWGNVTARASILGSSTTQTFFAPGTSGWASIGFPVKDPAQNPIRNGLLGWSGLPAIGFNVVERNNSAEAGNNRNYGSGRPHVVDLIAP